jgi:hypothetical protein
MLKKSVHTNGGRTTQQTFDINELAKTEEMLSQVAPKIPTIVA